MGHSVAEIWVPGVSAARLRTFLLLAATVLATARPALAVEGQSEDRWLRTAQGWQRESQVFPKPVYEPGLHPLVPASLISMLALLMFVATRRESRPTAAE